MTRKKLLKFCSSAEFDRTVHQVTAKHSKELPRSILPLISLISNGALIYGCSPITPFTAR